MSKDAAEGVSEGLQFVAAVLWWKFKGWIIAGAVVAVVVGAFLLAGCSQEVPAAKPAPSPYAEIRAAVHQLYDVEAKEASGCSGVMIAPMTMLTAAHCLGGTKQLEAGVERVPAKVLKKDETADLALLRVAMQCPCVPVGTALTTLDEPVVAVGFPMNAFVRAQLLTEGRAQGIATFDEPVGTRLRFTAPVINGNSGGGLFAYREGRWELVGIVTNLVIQCVGFGSCAAVTHLGMAAGLDSIHPFLAPPPRGRSLRCGKSCRAALRGK